MPAQDRLASHRLPDIFQRQLVCDYVPDPDRLAVTAAGDLRAVRAEADTIDRFRVPLQRRLPLKSGRGGHSRMRAHGLVSTVPSDTRFSLQGCPSHLRSLRI